MSGSIASDPRYGLAVTASTPRMSYNATAWRAAVEPMSPRFASATNGTSGGTRPRIRSKTAMPADPNASKKARFGFTAAAYGKAASSRTSQNRSMPERFGAKPSGSASGEGSTPRQRTEPTVRVRAAKRSRYVFMAGRLADRRTAHHERESHSFGSGSARNEDAADHFGHQLATDLGGVMADPVEAGSAGPGCDSSWAPSD